MNISSAALRRLQVLYGQYEAHTLDCSPGREARLAWASQKAGRAIASFSDLTAEEGKRLIDGLQGILGTKVPSKTPRRRMGRKAAEKAGTEGRRDQLHNETTMVSAADLERIQREMTRLGWDEAGLQRFLLGKSNPIGGRTQILTLHDANRVYWALKNIPARKEQLAAS